ncbi:MAG: hypothetical protein M1812_007248 [Candelaria pacifica]|nr:MAG: hypothetical protein M1812_007248 [Candelaria pacifica]
MELVPFAQALKIAACHPMKSSPIIQSASFHNTAILPKEKGFSKSSRTKSKDNKDRTKNPRAPATPKTRMVPKAAVMSPDTTDEEEPPIISKQRLMELGFREFQPFSERDRTTFLSAKKDRRWEELRRIALRYNIPLEARKEKQKADEPENENDSDQGGFR